MYFSSFQMYSQYINETMSNLDFSQLFKDDILKNEYAKFMLFLNNKIANSLFILEQLLLTKEVRIILK